METTHPMEDRWLAWRHQMPVTERWAYLDHAAVAPLPAPAQAVMTAWTDDSAQNGDVFWPRWNRQVQRVRDLAAQLIHADPDEIALVRNTTEGVTLIAEGFPWRPGDNVVLPAEEFPTNLYPWLNLQSRGVEVRRAANPQGRLDPADLERLCDACTRLVAVSWVGYATGWRNDLDALAEMAHRRGALLFVDAIQGLGVFPLDVARTPIDFLAADGHKWLLGPEGAGVCYIRRQHLERLRPLGVGWNSVAHAGQYDNPHFLLKPTAARYEGGTYPVPGFLGLAASLELLLQTGVAAISERILALSERACERLQQAGAIISSDRRLQHASGIVAFELAGRAAAEVRQVCLQRGVVLSQRAGRLRISPHVYNDESDLDRLLSALAES